MKKTFYYIAAASLTLGLTSCAKEAVTPEPPATPEPTGLITIVANIADDASTKTTLSGDDLSGYDVLWSEGDQIRFYGGESVKKYFTYTLTKGAGTKSGVFTGPAVPESIAPTEYATYGDNLTFGYVGLLAEEQYYAPNNGAFSFPMAAKISVSNGEVVLGDFKNIGGLLRLDLKGSGTVKEIKISANEPLSGGAIRIGEDGAAAFDSGSWLSSHKYVTLNCGARGVELTSEAKPFYISLLKNDYTGVKIEITDADDQIITKTLKAGKTLNIKRAMITPVAVQVLFSPKGSKGQTANKNGENIDWVQLWAGGPKWATKNIDNGHHQWGVSSDGYYQGSSNLSGSTDNATVAWGGNWKLPTKANFDDLLSNCNITWTTQDGAEGILCTGKGAYAANSVFFPACGYWDKNGYFYNYKLVASHYWSSTYGNYTGTAYSLSMEVGKTPTVGRGYGYYSFSVRAITAK